MKEIRKFKEKLSRNKAIRDYFLDKPYGKVSGLKLIGRRLKECLFNWSKKEMQFFGGWVGLSAATTLLLHGIFEWIGDVDVFPSLLGLGVLSSAIAFLHGVMSRKSDSLATFLWVIVPLFAGFLTNLYLTTGSLPSMIGSAIFACIIFFPVTIALTACVVSLVRNIKRLLLNPNAKNDVWQNLTIEDHEFVSQHMTKDEFLVFLKHIKKYDDLYLYEMESLRKKESKELALKKVECKRQEELDIQENKIQNYADIFYDGKNGSNHS